MKIELRADELCILESWYASMDPAYDILQEDDELHSRILQAIPEAGAQEVPDGTWVCGLLSGS